MIDELCHRFLVVLLKHMMFFLFLLQNTSSKRDEGIRNSRNEIVERIIVSWYIRVTHSK